MSDGERKMGLQGLCRGVGRHVSAFLGFLPLHGDDVKLRHRQLWRLLRPRRPHHQRGRLFCNHDARLCRPGDFPPGVPPDPDHRVCRERGDLRLLLPDRQLRGAACRQVCPRPLHRSSQHRRVHRALSSCTQVQKRRGHGSILAEHDARRGGRPLPGVCTHTLRGLCPRFIP